MNRIFYFSQGNDLTIRCPPNFPVDFAFDLAIMHTLSVGLKIANRLSQ